METALASSRPVRGNMSNAPNIPYLYYVVIVGATLPKAEEETLHCHVLPCETHLPKYRHHMLDALDVSSPKRKQQCVEHFHHLKEYDAIAYRGKQVQRKTAAHAINLSSSRRSSTPIRRDATRRDATHTHTRTHAHTHTHTHTHTRQSQTNATPSMQHTGRTDSLGPTHQEECIRHPRYRYRERKHPLPDTRHNNALSHAG